MSLFKKKEEKSLLQWTIETDGKYQSQLIDLIAERNDRINKAIDFINRYSNLNLKAFDTKKILLKIKAILKGEDNDE